MKLALIFLVCFITSSCATQRMNLQIPSDIPHYQEVAKKFMVHTNNLDEDKLITGRVTNGTRAGLGQFPYQVYLYLLLAAGTKLCGGSVSINLI